MDVLLKNRETISETCINEPYWDQLSCEANRNLLDFYLDFTAKSSFYFSRRFLLASVKQL
jgi:hypothetical protein